jgi:membrane protein DedA with SNARE-associated domain
MMRQLVAIVLGTLVSEDLTTIGVGLLTARGELPWFETTLACTVGIYLGDLGLWATGRLIGARVLRWPRVAAYLPPSAHERFAEWFSHHARVTILGSRFTPGTRLPLYLAAGACRTSFTTFAVWSLLAVALWTPLLVAFSALAGDQLAARLAGVFAAGRIAVIAAAVVVLAGWRAFVRLFSRRGRQKLAARCARLWRWEFWPMWLFYAPVAVWTALLAIRHRGYHTITAANPGMPDGGVVGESKFEILRRLPQEWTIPAVLVPPGDPKARRDALIQVMRFREWTFPMVLKPDVGQRGSGVRVARNQDDALRYFARMGEPVIAQPYHEGPFEAGLFYYRMPGWRRGRILCVTDKHFPVVTGDGRSTLEDLIWSHPRYRMQARTFFERLGTSRSHVPAAGEHAPLGIAGNHAQGAMFTDGRELMTPALEARVDDIARSYEGFYIGRFDVRYRDRKAFAAGDDLAIVELNGATAECTNIYDPAKSLFAAYRQLFVQWRLVFAIGAANRRLGERVTTPRRLLALIRVHLASSTPFPISD